MADLVSHGNHDRNIEQALIVLKKGTQLIKYSRQGKPKLRLFRLSPDETTLIWLSHGRERILNLSSVSRIIPGQRTAVFRRYLCPEKDYLSFSLIYNNGERSLDLICKDKAETEVWLSGLKALTSSRQRGRHTKSDSSDLTDNGELGRSSFGSSLDYNSSVSSGRISTDSLARENLFLGRPDVGLERGNMQPRASTGDGFRVSVSSTPSCSSGAYGTDDIESLGDVYVWGELWADSGAVDASGTPIPVKTEVLVPKSLESNVVLDVHQIASGARHIALVTRQGEVFTWGEESGGRLGLGVDKDRSHPQLVDFLAASSVDFVACGEQHTCAVSTSGDLFTWGDGSYNAGVLGHGIDVSHWIPKRVTGPLEGLQVISVACGAWHSAVATSSGKLFTFGDGTFGVLGHGDRESVSFPKEVKSLVGLKTIKVACGVWHTAAIMEVMGQSGVNSLSRKLFTWGDGDKYRLGHGGKESYLLPTRVSALLDYNFHQLACGHTMTVGLTTSGHVFIVGSNEHGQLGNPSADGKIPCLVQDKLVGEFVEEISCGAYHVAALTSRSEVYTWGLGTNGRLGHGDTKGRKSPTLVEALKDRQVKNISCGSNFTACICIHKWVSGADQSLCTGCRQAFGFTRKRHNCYNCGLVHCHACSSKKALKAALAPNPGKPHRVCDACYAKLKASESGVNASISRKSSVPIRSIDGRERTCRPEIKSYRLLLPPAAEPIRFLDVKSWGPELPGTRAESPPFARGSQAPSGPPLKDIGVPSSLTAVQGALKPSTTPAQSVPSPPKSRPASPYSKRSSSPLSSTPVLSRGLMDNLRKTNELLNQEVSKLQNQMRNLKQKSNVHDLEIQKLQRRAKELHSMAEEESSRYRSAEELIRSMTKQLKEISEQIPSEVSNCESLKAMQAEVEAFLNNMLESEISSSLTSSANASSKQNECRMDYNKDCAHEPSNPQSSENLSRSPESSKVRKDEENQVVEQFEPGVYVTLAVLPNGNKAFKRVRFSKRWFDEHQAEEWWNKNKDRLLKKYSPPLTGRASTGSSGSQPQAEENTGPSHSS